jgi:hypothetical protein
LRIDRSLWLFLLLAFAFASFPNWAGILNPPEPGEWTGILSRNTADVNGYLGIMEEVKQGNFRTHNLFTAEPHPAFQIRPVWIFLGLLARILPDLPGPQVLEIGRAFFSLCFLFLMAQLTSFLFATTRERILGFLVLVFGAGFGWLRLVPDAPDLRIVETSTFLAILSPPLYSVSLSLVVLILFCVWRLYATAAKASISIIAGIAALWLGFDRPFSLATLGIAIVGMVVADCIVRKNIDWKRAIALFPIAAGAAFAIVYQMWAVKNIPVYAAWNRQHILPTPGWLSLVTALGLLIPLAIAGAPGVFREHRHLGFLAAFYIAAALLLSHLPVGFQERFLEGWPVMTAIFAAFGLNSILNRIPAAALRTATATIVLVALSASHYFSIRNDLVAIARQAPPQYMPHSVLDAMRSLKTLAKPGEAILSAEATGNFLVAESGRQVVLGHKIATADYPQKWKLVSQYLQTAAEDPRSAELFEKSQAKWLFWGPEETLMSRGIFQPDRASYLVEKYSHGVIRIFSLK